MKTFKSALTKLSSITLAVLFAVGCATVTDANVELQDLNEEQTHTATTTQTIPTNDDNWFSRIGNDMDPIIDERDNRRN